MAKTKLSESEWVNNRISAVEPPSYYNGVDAYSKVALTLGNSGSFEAVFHTEKTSGLSPIIGLPSGGTPWLVQNGTTFYTKIGSTYFSNMFTGVVAFKKYHLLMTWNDGIIVVKINGVEILNSAYTGSAALSYFGFGKDSVPNYFKGVVYWCKVRNSDGDIIYSGSGLSSVEPVNVVPDYVDYLAILKNENFEYTSFVKNDDGVIESGVVLWEDGSPGVITFGDYNSGAIAFDSYSVTHTVSGLELSQPKITRDENFEITVKPLKIIS